MTLARACIARAALAAALLAPTARAADWQPVPGAPDLALELESMQARGASVTVWVRGLALDAVSRVAAPLPVDAKWHRTLARLQLDCRSRSAQALAVLGYDGAGRLVHSSSVPSSRQALPGEGALASLFDAACELARSQA